MLKRSFILSGLVLLSSFVLGTPSTIEGICRDLGITRQIAIDWGGIPHISRVLSERTSFLHPYSDKDYADREIWGKEYRNRVLPRLRQECNSCLEKVRFDQLQASIAASNKQNAAQLKGLEERLDQFVGQLQFGQLQTAFNTSNKQSTAQLKGLEQQVRRLEEQVNHLVLCNTRLMEFLSREHAIVSTQTDDLPVESGSGQSEKL